MKNLLESLRPSTGGKNSSAAGESPGADCKNRAAGLLQRWHAPLSMRISRRQHGAANKRSGSIHDNVSDDFYRLWLDEQMIHSCAYFADPRDNLEQAQRNRLDHVCRKLRLKKGETMLDIGCGWGAFLIWAAKRYGVKAHGITLNRNHYEHASGRIRMEKLDDRVSVELRDVREIDDENRYDKIASIGLIRQATGEHLPEYLAAAHRLLQPGGLFLNHGITQDTEKKRPAMNLDPIRRYFSSDQELNSIGHFGREMEKELFEILDIESLRNHYALTLRHWVHRLESNHLDACRHVSEAAYRAWRLHMAGSAQQLEQGAMGFYQILAAKKHGKNDVCARTFGINPFPATLG